MPPSEIRIFEEGHVIACHPVLESRNLRRVGPGHRKAPLPSRRSRSAQHGNGRPLGEHVGRRSLAFHDIVAQRLAAQETRRIDVALKTAKLMPIKTLEGFDFGFQTSLDRECVAALAQLDFIRRAEVAHFLGPSGTGMSHLATTLGVAAVKAGKSVYRATLAELIEALVKAEREGWLAEKLRFHARTSLLIVDEIGYLPISNGGGNLFFQLVGLEQLTSS